MNQGLKRDPQPSRDHPAPAQGDQEQARLEPGVESRCETQPAPASSHPQAGRGHGQAPGAEGGDTLAPVAALSNRPGPRARMSHPNRGTSLGGGLALCRAGPTC